ncbi:MAG TPA: ATP-binding protein [Mycobacteriales bacterium]|nr:ATP-binding protein [Mycobacteriales bacterium]
MSLGPKRRVSSWWNGRSLRAKVLLVVATPLLGVVVASGSAVWVNAQALRAEKWVQHTLQVRETIATADAAVSAAGTGAQSYLLTGDAQGLLQARQTAQSLPGEVAVLASLVRDNPAEASRAKLLSGLVNRQLALVGEVLAARTPGVPSRAGSALLGRLRVGTSSIRAGLAAMDQVEHQLLLARTRSDAVLRHRQLIAAASSGLIALVGGCLAALLFSAGVLRRVRRLDENARRLNQGVDLLPIAGADELGRLGRTLAEVNTLLAESERGRRSSEAFLHSVVENLPNMVFAKDAEDLRFTLFNRAGTELVGVPAAELLGKSVFDLFPADQAEFFEAKDRQVLTEGTLVDIAEEPMQDASGQTRILHTKKVAILDAEGNPAYLLGISEDITDRKRIESALHGATMDAEAARQAAEQATLEAERANRAKSEFLSRMSHELRTPLNAILGFGQLLQLDQLTADQRESVQQIDRGGRHLLALINEVLDISRIETGKLTLSAEPVAVAELLAETLDLLRPLAGGAGLRLEAPDSGPWLVQADRQRLKQILLNLVSNAIKYNRPGGTVAVSCRQNGEDRLAIAVTDTGPGIAAENMQRLFVPFDRLGAEQTAVEGTGIGLALAHRLAEAMGGSLTAESRPGQGSTFTLELSQAAAPFHLPTQAQAKRPPATRGPTGKGRTILHVEDNPANQRLVERLLVPRGLRVVATAAGEPVGELVRRHRPALVLLDLHLTGIDGQEVLRRLRSEPDTAATPVVVLSADASAGQIQRLLDAGASDYLTKPLDLTRLVDVIEAILTAGAAL